MGVDIRINIDLPGHPKYKRLKRIIQSSPMEYLVCFWGYVARYAPTGQLHGWCPEEIEDAAGWDGDPGVFCSALLSVGFLDELDDGFEPHDWCDHQTWVIKAPERTEKAKKAANKRWAEQQASTDKPQTSQYDNANGMQQACNKHAVSIAEPHAPSPSPSPSPFLKEESSSSSISEVIPMAVEDQPPAKETMTMKAFAECYQQTFGVMMPGMLNQEARDCCQRYPPDRIVEAFRITAEKGGKSFSYVKSCLEGKARASPAAIVPMSKGEQRTERNKASAIEALRLMEESRNGKRMGGEAYTGATGVVIDIGS